MKTVVGKVTPEEITQIQKLFERKNGLIELTRILDADNNGLYEKIVADIGETNVKYQEWWNTMSQKYNWKSSPNGQWEIEFQTGTVFLHLND